MKVEILKLALATLILFLSVACTYESTSPEAIINLKVTPKDFTAARIAMYQFGIQENMFIYDESHKWPSGGSIVNLKLTSPDGLDILMLGGESRGQFYVAFYCNKKCKDWKTHYKKLKNELEKNWELVNK